jgi:hypothetical protein
MNEKTHAGSDRRIRELNLFLVKKKQQPRSTSVFSITTITTDSTTTIATRRNLIKLIWKIVSIQMMILNQPTTKNEDTVSDVSFFN